MTQVLVLLALWALTLPVVAQEATPGLSHVAEAKDYIQKRASSYDRSGANADFRTIAPGDTLTLIDEAGPGLISHIWVTIASDDADHLKALVLRMYWDGESSPSVEAPIGDFFGLGLGDYFLYQSLPLSPTGTKQSLTPPFRHCHCSLSVFQKFIR